MRAYERFLEYVKIYSTSCEENDCTPTTERQFDMSRLLASQMEALGMEDVLVDEYAYVYGHIPASEGYEKKPAIGFIAHIDTAPDFCGEGVKPQLVENYDGSDVKLGDSGRVLSVEEFPHLLEMKGHTLITTDGTTLLGADDKAGVAEILTACERILQEKLPHGPVSVCFTPDEEVGHGASLLDLERFAADFAFTVDGGDVRELNFETFNAASARWEIQGRSIHPGEAKNKMLNASLVAMEVNAMLPAGDTPSHTEGYEGFYHLCDMKGNMDKAELNYIIRDHDATAFRMRKQCMEHIAALINEKYGEGTAKVKIAEQYRNMAEHLKDRMDIVELAKRAITRSCGECLVDPIRGGTDGAQLTFRGLLCPNLGTGGFCFHGPLEHISVQHMDLAVENVLNIVDENIR